MNELWIIPVTAIIGYALGTALVWWYDRRASYREGYQEGLRLYTDTGAWPNIDQDLLLRYLQDLLGAGCPLKPLFVRGYLDAVAHLGITSVSESAALYARYKDNRA